MECIDSGELADYKFMCFNGKVEYIFVCHNRFKKGGVYQDFYNKNFEREYFDSSHPISDIIWPKPKNFDRMVELAEKYSTGMAFLRVDFYEIEGELFFGEFTFYSDGGLTIFNPHEINIKLGDLIKLPKKTQ